MSQRRVPRSPLSANSRPLAASDSAYGDLGPAYAFDIPTPSDSDDGVRDLGELSARLSQLPTNPELDERAEGKFAQPSSIPTLPSWSD